MDLIAQDPPARLQSSLVDGAGASSQPHPVVVFAQPHCFVAPVRDVGVLEELEGVWAAGLHDMRR